MKKVIFFILIFCVFCSLKGIGKSEMPDPLNITYPPSDEESLETKVEKPNDPRTLEEKFRDKFHLKPSKKIYLHNIDRSSQPVTVEDYLAMAKDKKRADFIIPEPVFNHDPKYIVISESPHYRVVRFNNPPGQRNIDVSQLINNRTASSLGILSPDNKKMVYTKSFFYPRTAQTSSAAYYIPVKENKDAYEALYKTNVMQGVMNPIVEVGMDNLIKYQFVTLFPIDWSKDSSKIAFKEKIGSNIDETWQTNVIIYDFNTKSWKRLNAVREAIIYWWRIHQKVDLKDYLWDIFPVGWDKNNPERLIVYAYAFSDSHPMFLGTWSIDYNEEKSQLVSINDANVEIDLNGFGLQEVKLEN